jgi:hypothetical protein
MSDVSKELADALEAFANGTEQEHEPTITEPSAKVIKRRKAAAARVKAMMPPKPRKKPAPPEPWDTGLF